MILPITALMAGILVLWGAYLSLTVSFARARHQVPLGNGGDASELNRFVRVHGNTAEYSALFIVVLALLEFHGLRSEVMYVLGGVFILGRVLHRQALLSGSLAMRLWAMQLTHWPLIIGALILAYTWFTHTFLLG
ncbi:hypothetical protein CL655_01570 [bacterium]|nr:hypothetical protein [bacterium]|tara:strand:+ start:944 stop:1348 length:405 start_codon:yes stop_codon:yes gene_type:complete